MAINGMNASNDPLYFLNEYLSFKNETIKRVWWNEKQWQLIAQRNSSYHKFIKSAVYYFNNLVQVKDKTNLVLTLFNKESIPMISVKDIFLEIDNIVDMRLIKGFYFPRFNRFLVLSFPTEEIRNKVASELKMVNGDFVVNSDWVAKNYRVGLVVKWLPPDIKKAEVIQFLEEYFYDIQIYREYEKINDQFSARSGQLRGSVLVKSIYKIKDIPHLCQIRDSTGLVLIFGREPLCFKCMKVGHFARECWEFQQKIDNSSQQVRVPKQDVSGNNDYKQNNACKNAQLNKSYTTYDKMDTPIKSQWGSSINRPLQFTSAIANGSYVLQQELPEGEMISNASQRDNSKESVLKSNVSMEVQKMVKDKKKKLLMSSNDQEGLDNTHTKSNSAMESISKGGNSAKTKANLLFSDSGNNIEEDEQDLSKISNKINELQHLLNQDHGLTRKVINKSNNVDPFVFSSSSSDESDTVSPVPDDMVFDGSLGFIHKKSSEKLRQEDKYFAVVERKQGFELVETSSQFKGKKRKKKKKKK